MEPAIRKQDNLILIRKDIMSEIRYRLGPGTQVREEAFGLLFYTMDGPRLYFFSSGETLDPTFFSGQQTLRQWINNHGEEVPNLDKKIRAFKKSLRELVEKGVILEC